MVRCENTWCPWCRISHHLGKPLHCVRVVGLAGPPFSIVILGVVDGRIVWHAELDAVVAREDSAVDDPLQAKAYSALGYGRPAEAAVRL